MPMAEAFSFITLSPVLDFSAYLQAGAGASEAIRRAAADLKLEQRYARRRSVSPARSRWRMTNSRP